MRPTVLLVEDEPDLLQVLTMALERALPDYQVLVAETILAAEAALLSVEKQGGAVALVLADHKIAGDGRTGLALIEAVRARHPAAATFLFTGQAAPEVEDRARELGTRVLWKPLRLASLMAEVQGALAR